jgi:hypothetical protein
MTQQHIIPLALLRPTQITVGLLQVKHKRKSLRSLTKRPAELVEFILEHPVRIVMGPAERAYVIDHHHLALALIKERYETAPMQVEEDFSTCSMKEFWKKMQARKFVHPYDAQGRRKPLTAIPKQLKHLEDDPYRSLAGFVRIGGGFAKVQTPFAEFLWADYFRTRIARDMIEDHFTKALKNALVLAADAAAKSLPGYLPPKKRK